MSGRCWRLNCKAVGPQEEAVDGGKVVLDI